MRPDDAVGSVPELIKGRYRIVDTLSQTSAVVVYAADDLEKDRRVTLAVLRGEAAADAEFTGAARQQVHRLAKPEIAHPAVVRVYGCDTTETGALFVVSEPVAGRPLRAVLEQRGALDLRSTLRLVNQIGEALETLHPNGVVHGELRPETVFVTTTEGGIDAVKLPGLELVTAHRTALGVRLLDPSAVAYLAPEQVERGETTEAADVHGLGLLLRELVTGERPGATGPRPEAAGDLPPAIRRIVAKALAHQPIRRYGSVSLMLNELWTAAPTAAPAAGMVHVAPERRSAASRYARSDLGMATALVLGLLLVGVTAWVVTSERLAGGAAPNATEPPVASSRAGSAASVPSVGKVTGEPAAPPAGATAAQPARQRTEPVRPSTPGTVTDVVRETAGPTGVRAVVSTPAVQAKERLAPAPGQATERVAPPPGQATERVAPPPAQATERGAAPPPAKERIASPSTPVKERVSLPPLEVKERQPAPPPRPIARTAPAPQADATDGSAIIDWLLKERRE